MARRAPVRIVVAVLVGAGVALAGTRLLLAGDGEPAGTPPAVVQRDDRDPDLPLTAAEARAIPSNRLAPFGPQSLFDNRSGDPLAPGDEVNVSLLDVAEASTAVVLALSALDATRAGAVTVTSSAGAIPALRLSGAGAQTSSTLIVPVAGDGALRIRDEAGGRLAVQLVGTLEPSSRSAEGRVVPVPSREIFRLVKASEGHEKELALDAVPELSGRSVSAVLLQVAADVGTDGGFVRAGDEDRQELFWSATSGADRTRGGLMLLPVDGDTITIHYEAGTELRADLVGYVTGTGAPESVEGLTVLVPPTGATPTGATPTGATPTGAPSAAEVGAAPRTLTVVPPTGLAGVPLNRIGGAFLRVTAEGTGTGDVSVRGGTSAADQGNPTLLAAQGVSRSMLTLVTVSGGAVSAEADAGAALTLTPEAILLTAE